MRQLGRAIIAVSVVASSLACLFSSYLLYRGYFRKSGACAFVRSVRVDDGRFHSSEVTCYSGRGGIGLWWLREDYRTRFGPGGKITSGWWLTYDNAYPARVFGTPSPPEPTLGFSRSWASYEQRQGIASTVRGAVVPLWCVVLVTGVLPAVRTRALARRWVVRRRTVDGRCGGCGYDLRMTPEKCPECGRTSQ